MRLYAMLSAAPRPASYLGKILTVSFIGVHLPMIVAVLYVLLSADMALADSVNILVALLLATLAGTEQAFAFVVAETIVEHFLHLLGPGFGAAGAHHHGDEVAAIAPHRGDASGTRGLPPQDQQRRKSRRPQKNLNVFSSGVQPMPTRKC